MVVVGVVNFTLLYLSPSFILLTFSLLFYPSSSVFVQPMVSSAMSFSTTPYSVYLPNYLYLFFLLLPLSPNWCKVVVSLINLPNFSISSNGPQQTKSSPASSHQLLDLFFTTIPFTTIHLTITVFPSLTGIVVLKPVLLIQALFLRLQIPILFGIESGEFVVVLS